MEIFKLFGSIFVDNEKANKSIHATDSKARGLAKSLGGGIKTAAKWGAGIAVAAGAAGGALMATATKAAESTDRIDKMSQRLGLSRKGFQEWDYVLGQAGISIDSMQSGMKSLSQRMDDSANGVGKGAELFKRLGVSVTDANGEFRNQEEVFNETIRALQEMDDGVEKAAMAQELFGRSGQELLPLLNSEADSVDELKQKANEMGLVMSDEAVDAGVLFTDTMDGLKRSLSVAFSTIGVELMPMFQKLAAWIETNMPTIMKVSKAVFKAISTAVSVAVDVFKTYFLPILKDIYEWVDANLPAIKKVFQIAFKVIGTVITTIWEIYKVFFSIIKEVYDFVKGPFKAIGKAFIAAFEGVTAFIGGIVDGITGIIDAAKDAINWLKSLFDAKDGADSKPVDYSDPRTTYGDGYTTSYPGGGTGMVKPAPQEVHHSGTVTHKGVNDKEELVAVVQETIEQDLVDGDRRIPTKPRLIGAW